MPELMHHHTVLDLVKCSLLLRDWERLHQAQQCILGMQIAQVDFIELKVANIFQVELATRFARPTTRDNALTHLREFGVSTIGILCINVIGALDPIPAHVVHIRRCLHLDS